MKITTYVKVVILTLLTFQSTAQYGGTCTNEDIQNKFMKSTVLVPVTGNEEFDAKIKKGFEKYWKLTPFEFVESVTAEQAKDPAYSIMQKFKMMVEDVNSFQSYDFYGVVMPGKKTDFNKVAAYIVLDEFGFEKDLDDMSYRAENMVKMMHDFIELRNNGEPISGGSFSRVRYTTGPIYNKRHDVLKGKTLLVDKRHLKQQTGGVYGGKKEMSQADFKNFYGGPVEFVSTEEYMDALEKNDSNYACFMPIYSRKKYLFVVDCESGSICYELYATSGLFFSKKDLGAMKKALGY